MREIVLDTETTGLDPFDGHRTSRSAASSLSTASHGRVWHCHLNPERDVPYAAFEVHGLSLEFPAEQAALRRARRRHALFHRGAMLVMHNAAFDSAFSMPSLTGWRARCCAGAGWLELRSLWRDAATSGDAVQLDALCKRLRHSWSEREEARRTARLRLLARVYAELVGGNQTRLDFAVMAGRRLYCSRMPFRCGEVKAASDPLTPAEIEAHRAFVASLGEKPLAPYSC